MSKLMNLTSVAVALMCTAAAFAGGQANKGKYAEVNGLKMYYEVRGTGKPLLLLHGAFGTVEGWGPVLPALEKSRQVIVVEMQSHGRTADIDRPLSVDQMADDVAAFIKKLDLKQVDVFGYSMGGMIGFRLAMKHPELIGKLAVLGSGTGSMKETYDAESYKLFQAITPETFNFPEMKDPYTKVAPDPSKWGVLVTKIAKMVTTFPGYPLSEVKTIKAPTLIMLGDREGLKVEHAVDIYRAIPNAQLAIIPGADHFLIFTGADKVLGLLLPFLGDGK